MKLLSKIILFCFLAGPVFAQTKKEPTLQDIQQEMLEMQRRFFQQFQQDSPDDPANANPQFKWDTTFTFRFDTLSDGQRIGRSFFFSPFGQDTTFMRGFGGSDPFFDGFNPFGDLFQWPFPPERGVPQNDENSALGDPGDGLLPEERLRKEPEGDAKAPQKKPQTPAKKPKTKTFQI